MKIINICIIKYYLWIVNIDKHEVCCSFLLPGQCIPALQLVPFYSLGTLKHLFVLNRPHGCFQKDVLSSQISLHWRIFVTCFHGSFINISWMPCRIFWTVTFGVLSWDSIFLFSFFFPVCFFFFNISNKTSYLQHHDMISCGLTEIFIGTLNLWLDI